MHGVHQIDQVPMIHKHTINFGFGAQQKHLGTQQMSKDKILNKNTSTLEFSK